MSTYALISVMILYFLYNYAYEAKCVYIQKTKPAENQIRNLGHSMY